MPQFKIGGQSYTISNDEVNSALKGVKPEPITRYFVEIDSKKYPIKQVPAKVFGIPRIGFTSMDAYRVLENWALRSKRLKT